MKRLIAILAVTWTFTGCGGTETYFGGTWSGSFAPLTNNCPFQLKSDINPLFPITVSIDENDNYTVIAIDGSIANGGQGSGETNSFLAKASRFGDYGTSSPFDCESSTASVGFIEKGANNATVTLQYKFTNCRSAGTSKATKVCSTVYSAEATRIQ
jgi:hypothetical protein